MRDARSSIFNKLLITKDASEKQVVELYSNIELGRATVKQDNGTNKEVAFKTTILITNQHSDEMRLEENTSPSKGDVGFGVFKHLMGLDFNKSSPTAVVEMPGELSQELPVKLTFAQAQEIVEEIKSTIDDANIVVKCIEDETPGYNPWLFNELMQSTKLPVLQFAKQFNMSATSVYEASAGKKTIPWDKWLILYAQVEKFNSSKQDK